MAREKMVEQNESHEVLCMKRQKTRRTVVGMTLMLFAGTFTWGQSESQSTKKPYQPNESEGYVTGTVSLTGTPPGPKKIDMSADPVCAQSNRHPLTEGIVAKGGRLANVLIYVKTGAALEGLSFEAPATNVVLDQRGCRFIPHLLGLRVNQTLEIRNSDRTTHNVHATPRISPDWNMSQSAGAEPLLVHFARSEVVIPIKCNQHPWMKAYVGVFAHPFFAVSDKRGAFRIEGLPPGDYTIAAWHEEFGEKTFQVTIKAGAEETLRIRFSATDRRLWR